AIDPFAGEARACEPRRDHLEATAVVRGNRRARNQLLRERKRRAGLRCPSHTVVVSASVFMPARSVRLQADQLRSQDRSSSLIEVFARVAASTRFTMTAH